MTFAFNEPWFFLLLLLLLPLWRNYQRRSKIGIPVSANALFKGLPRSRLASLRHSGITLRSLTLVCLVMALARPQFGKGEIKRFSEGLDIMMVVDTSGSMRAQDFLVGNERPTRLEVVKRVMAEFIGERSSDRLGIVVFGTEAFTQSPLTMDHQVLLEFLSKVQISMAGDATAIGDGIATAVKRLKDVEAKSRVVILLTDGTNTAGRVDPLAATAAAKTLGVKVYTIGVGRDGQVPMVIRGRMQNVQVDIDEGLLKKIAEETGGRYFRAENTETLVNVYRTIDKLETTKTEIKEHKDYEERFALFLWPALALLLADLGFSLTRFQRIP